MANFWRGTGLRRKRGAALMISRLPPAAAFMALIRVGRAPHFRQRLLGSPIKHHTSAIAVARSGGRMRHNASLVATARCQAATS